MLQNIFNNCPIFVQIKSLSDSQCLQAFFNRILEGHHKDSKLFQFLNGFFRGPTKYSPNPLQG